MCVCVWGGSPPSFIYHRGNCITQHSNTNTHTQVAQLCSYISLVALISKVICFRLPLIGYKWTWRSVCVHTRAHARARTHTHMCKPSALDRSLNTQKRFLFPLFLFFLFFCPCEREGRGTRGSSIDPHRCREKLAMKLKPPSKAGHPQRHLIQHYL